MPLYSAFGNGRTTPKYLAPALVCYILNQLSGLFTNRTQSVRWVWLHTGFVEQAWAGLPIVCNFASALAAR